MRNYLNINDEMTVNFCKSELGYFISYEDLFSSWIKANSEVQNDTDSRAREISVATISEAINRFDQSISREYISLYEGFFKSFEINNK